MKNSKQSFPSMGTERKSNGAKNFPAKTTDMKYAIGKSLSKTKEFPVSSKGVMPKALPIRGASTRNS